MPKLTADLIEQAAQYTNPLKEREIDLRGYKIPVIENLGATLDQFDTIDFSDNELRKLEGFPLLRRLKCLLLNNNRICRISEGLEKNLPRLESVILTNNLMQELGDLDPLATIATLTTLSLLRNPLTNRKHYRLYTIHKIPQIRVLDFRRVRQKEREAANHLFKGKKGQQLSKDLGRRSKTFVPGAPVVGEGDAKPGPSPQDYAAIKEAIVNATSLEEVERLNQMLKTGQVPGKESLNKKRAGEQIVEEEEMEQDETPPEVVNGAAALSVA
ncbi:U2 small nuclear ribonucleoprotein A'-like [Asterias amurensis]|uniref:U2 small nuclear ribonucleoprotein A'-like n=1 Tax=Asterias amurensis TaxID=7602 RepID=UPI003AB31CA9